MQIHAVSLICSASRDSTEAETLYAVVLCCRAAATAAALKGSSSFFTEHMMAPHAVDVIPTTTGRAAGDGCSAKVDNQRFTVVAQCYGLATLSRTTLIYALGRSGEARRVDLGS